MKCIYHNCNKELIGKQVNYCSIRCKNIVAVNKRRKKLKDMSIEYKGGCCNSCGYNKCTSALEFHHTDPEKKDFALSNGKTISWEKMKNELDKCVMLCSNCHREEHEKLLVVELVGFEPTIISD